MTQELLSLQKHLSLLHGTEVASVLTADVFGTGIFPLTSLAIKQVLASYPSPPLSYFFPPTSSARQFQDAGTAQ